MKNKFTPFAKVPFCLVIVGLASCGSPRQSILLNSGAEVQGIVGGRPDTEKDGVWRFTVRVNAGGLCSGVLIRKNVVLTAAHCIFKQSAEVFFQNPNNSINDTISVTKFNCGISAEEVSSRLEMAGPDYLSPQRVDEFKIWDICALKLARSPKSAFQPVGLLSGIPSDKEELIHVGFGMSLDSTGAHMGVRNLGVSHLIQSTPYTAESLEPAVGSHVIDGDSGGPVLIRRKNGEFKLLGVLSATFKAVSDGETFVQTKRAEPFHALWDDL